MGHLREAMGTQASGTLSEVESGLRGTPYGEILWPMLVLNQRRDQRQRRFFEV
jgi:hypothetical protein